MRRAGLRDPALPPSADPSWQRCEVLIKAFEEAWGEGRSPALKDYLHAEGPERHALLVELARVEMIFRLKAGDPARVESYLASYPELAADRRAVLALLAAEHDLRLHHGGGGSPDEYRLRFPEYADELSALLSGAAGDTLGLSAAPEPAPPGAPPAVPGYEILGELGRGGMGVVYKAREASLGRPVALKFLPPEYAHDPERLDRFLQEARTASALNHPHICTVHALGEHGGRPFLVMEFVDGKSLRALAARPPGVAEAARLVGQAARALAAAHAAGVVHRDIKPENVMVRGDGYVKVLDFGLARRLPALGGAGAEGGRRTDPGTFLGTAAYASPEQARGEAVGGATDVFALGVVLYELVTGRHPFEADTALGALHAVAAREPVPPSRLNPEVPAALEALVRQMLAKDPRLRPAAADVDAALAELTGKGAARPAAPPLEPARRPTVGRGGERAALRAAFASAAAGRGLVVCVTGEPGLGKTTLVDDFLAEPAAAGTPLSLGRGRCSERLAGAEAYLPFLEALDDLLHGADGAAAAQLMRVLAPSWYAQLAPLAAGDAALAPALAEARAASQEQRKRELGVFLLELARRRPLVLYLDDVHWADPSSVDLLAYLGGRCAGARLLLLLAYRPSDLALGNHPLGPVKLELQARGVCREIALPFLGREDLDRYLALTFPGHEFPEEFAAVLHARTEGNPLFLVDLLRYLRDREVIAQQQDRWALARAVPDLQAELPESVRGMIRRKVEQLGEADRRLLMAASVQGCEFDAAVVARVLGRAAAEVEERLDALDRVHALVRFVREHTFPDGTLTLRYGFVHVLYQNAFYATLLPTRKAAWSGTAALALLDHCGEKRASAAAELALLFEAARQPARAVEFFLPAARNAGGVFAHREAAGLARRGLALLETLPDTPARADQELALLRALGVSLIATKGFASPDVEETYARARELCLRANDTAGLFPVLYGLWNVYLLRCELGRCNDLATQMFALAQDRRDRVLLLQAHNVLQQPLLHQGDFAAARRHQEQCLALYDPGEHRTLTAVYGEDPGVGCLAYGAVTLWCLGYPDQALRSAEAARRMAEGLSNPFDVARALYFGAFTRLCRRETEATQELARALAELSDDQGFTMLQQGATALQGWALAAQGRPEEGIDRMRRGLAGWQATGALSHRPYQLALLAEALAREGRSAEGLAGLAEALALTAATGERFLEAELHRLRGELLAGAGAGPAAWGEAESCFRQALDVARSRQARSLELRAATSLARLYRRLGRGAEARPLLAEVYGWFTEGLETPDPREAKALLEQLS
jgi:predicted ATPase